MSKVQRWVDLLAALLRRNFPVDLEELKREVPAYLNTKTVPALRRTFERDKDELRLFGIPIVTEKDASGEVIGYTLRRDNFYLPYLSLLQGNAPPTKPRRRPDKYGYRRLPELAFESDELDAIVTAARRVSALGDPNLAELASSALRKLAFDLPVDASVREATITVRAGAVPGDVLEGLDDALRLRKRVRIVYHTMASDQTSEREVEPYGLFFLNSHWYLAANDAGTIKNFRVSRISRCTPNAQQPGTPDYTIPRSFDLRDHARSRQAWELGQTAAVEAIVAFDPRGGAAHAAARLGEPVDGQPAQRRFLVRRLDAFARWLLSFAGDAQPLSPPELVSEYRALSQATLAAYEGVAP